jgi:aryl-alcohol dehydrogenase-like predicted oxidoreductase
MDVLIPTCQEHGVAVIGRVILDEGGLSGFLQEDTVIPKGDYRYQYFDCLPRSVYIEKINQLKAYIPNHASSLVELAIRFVLHHPGVTTAITTMHIHEHVTQNMASAQAGPLTTDVFDSLRVKQRWVRNFTQARKHL